MLSNNSDKPFVFQRSKEQMMSSQNILTDEPTALEPDPNHADEAMIMFQFRALQSQSATLDIRILNQPTERIEPYLVPTWPPSDYKSIGRNIKVNDDNETTLLTPITVRNLDPSPTGPFQCIAQTIDQTNWSRISQPQPSGTCGFDHYDTLAAAVDDNPIPPPRGSLAFVIDRVNRPGTNPPVILSPEKANPRASCGQSNVDLSRLIHSNLEERWAPASCSMSSITDMVRLEEKEKLARSSASLHSTFFEPSVTATPISESAHGIKDIPPVETEFKTARSYIRLSRDAYQAMVDSLSDSAKRIQAPSEYTRKRWRRMVWYFEHHPDRPPFASLTWRGSHLIILPFELWDRVILDMHSSDLDPSHHLSLTQTFRKLSRHYETRHSRAGIPYSYVKRTLSRCVCSAPLSGHSAASKSTDKAASSIPTVMSMDLKDITLPSSSSTKTADVTYTPTRLPFDPCRDLH